MTRNVLAVACLLSILLSACGGNAPASTATPSSPVAPTERPTNTVAPTDTSTPAASPTLTSTPETPIPTNAPNCVNAAVFITDVTYPDNSPVAADVVFTKTWRIKNVGTCVWSPDYNLVPYSEERMSAPNTAPLPLTYPDQTADVSVALAAPNSLGVHRANFIIKTTAGRIMKIDNDSRLWVIVNVTSLAPTAAATAAGTTASTPATPGSATATASSGTGGGSGFANVTCAFSLDAAKVTETINAINAYRAKNGAPPYNVNPQLTQAAQAHANDMACNQLFVHTGSNGSTPATRVAASGYKASSVTENVYGSYPPLTGEGVVTWWANDKVDIRHNENLLSTTYVDIGVAYSFYNNFGYYVVVFAKP